MTKQVLNTERMLSMKTTSRYLDMSGITMLVGGMILDMSKKNTTNWEKLDSIINSR